MGQAVSVFALAVGAFIYNIFTAFSGDPNPSNSTVDQIQHHNEQERQRHEHEARENWKRQQREQWEREERKRRAHEDRERQEREAAEREEFRRREEEANKKVEEARKREEDALRKQADANRKEEESRAREEESRMIAEEAARQRREAEKQAERVAEEMERFQKEAEEQEQRGRVERERIQRMAEKQRVKDEEEKKVLLEEANLAQEKLHRGIKPIVWPTEEQFLTAKRRIQYNENLLHFAVSGVSGSGKSSLINAFRGLKSTHRGAAAVGTTETTLEIARYPDLRQDPPRFVWYDVPGAGTRKIPSWQYFNDQGLFIFDFIILVYDMRFTQTDADILDNCRRFDIPTFIVRSKANQHIQNIMMEMEDDEEEAEWNDDDPESIYEKAKEQHIKTTQSNLESNLKDYGLWNEGVGVTPPRCYIVSNSTIFDLAKGIGRLKEKYIDEIDLLGDVLQTAHKRRYSSSSNSEGKAKDYSAVKAAQAALSSLSKLGLGGSKNG